VTLVAERDSEMIGYAWGGLEGMDYMALRGPAGALYDIVVDPQYRRHASAGCCPMPRSRRWPTKGRPPRRLSTAERNDAAQRLLAHARFRWTVIEMTRGL
jgi:hypothetical protein